MNTDQVRGSMYTVTECYKNIFNKVQYRTLITTTDLSEAKKCLNDYDGINTVELWDMFKAELIEKKIPILHNENN
jgi:hypothetical protein